MMKQKNILINKGELESLKKALTYLNMSYPSTSNRTEVEEKLKKFINKVEKAFSKTDMIFTEGVQSK